MGYLTVAAVAWVAAVGKLASVTAAAAEIKCSAAVVPCTAARRHRQLSSQRRDDVIGDSTSGGETRG